MSGFQLSEWINQSQETVFNSLMDPSRVQEIMPNIITMEQLAGDAVGVGTRFRETRLVNGKEAQTELEVIAFDAPQRYGVSAVQEGITVSYFYDLSPHDGGTQVELECVVSASGLKKVMVPMVAGVMKKQDGQHLSHLKSALEANL
jgi:hypothetical protein